MNHQTAQTVLLVVACLALGFFFGVEITGRLAMQQFVGEQLVAVNTEWIHQAETLRWGSVAAFALSCIGATAVYARENSDK